MIRLTINANMGAEFRVASYGLRVASCELRVASYGLRVTGYGLRVAGCGLRVTGWFPEVIAKNPGGQVIYCAANNLTSLSPVSS